jgi:exosortase A
MTVAVSSPTSVAPWRVPLLAVSVTLVWILFWYRDTAIAMVTIWARSETFTHAFLVPPISAWLIWRQRHLLRRFSLRSSWSVLIVLALAGFAWLLGELAAVNAVTQLAMMALLVLVVPAILGRRVGVAMMFPLGYLFFAVPIGEFVMPQMMEWTAEFTIRALQLTGIPVYREGLSFVIPSGNWSVVEACSGVRYLIASVVVGTLYAYLNYRSMKRRLIFTAVSLVVPVVANWARAYMIVMLGHLSGNKLAVGVDHLIYGWVFFGVVIMLMFMIGSRWAEHPSPDEFIPEVTAESGRPQNSSRFWFVAGSVMVVTVIPVLWHSSIESREARPLDAPSIALSAPVGWQKLASAATSWRPSFASPNTEFAAEFANGANPVGLFIGYYSHQDYEHKLISSENALVKSSDRSWIRVASGSHQVSLGDRAVTVRTADLHSSTGEKITVWYWYWIDGHLTASDYVAKGYQALSRLLGRGDDSAVVMVYAPKGVSDSGGPNLETFVSAMGLSINEALHQVRYPASRQPD